MNTLTEKIELFQLDEAEARAQRMLDGQKFNREVVGRDIQAMARELRMWRERNPEVVFSAR